MCSALDGVTAYGYASLTLRTYKQASELMASCAKARRRCQSFRLVYLPNRSMVATARLIPFKSITVRLKSRGRCVGIDGRRIRTGYIATVVTSARSTLETIASETRGFVAVVEINRTARDAEQPLKIIVGYLKNYFPQLSRPRREAFNVRNECAKKTSIWDHRSGKFPRIARAFHRYDWHPSRNRACAVPVFTHSF